MLVFGEKRISRRTYVLASFLVAFGATLSAFWIIVANSWQQTPQGFEIVGGRAQLTSFFGALFNPSTIPRYTHTVNGAFLTASFFMFGIAAWYLLRGRHQEFAKRTFRAALIVAAISSIGQLLTGHHHAIQVEETQPAKLAAFEGLFETQRNAPLMIVGLPDVEARTSRGLAVPGMLSMLVGFSTDREVRGLNDFPTDQWPPILASFVPFHLMFIVGLFLIGFSWLGLLLLWRKALFAERSRVGRLYLKVALWAIPLPILGNILGWFAAEMGRQPWAVQGLLRTEDAISTIVTPAELYFSIGMFVLVYSLLVGLWVYLLALKVKAGPEALDHATREDAEVAP